MNSCSDLTRAKSEMYKVSIRRKDLNSFLTSKRQKLARPRGVSCRAHSLDEVHFVLKHTRSKEGLVKAGPAINCALSILGSSSEFFIAAKDLGFTEFIMGMMGELDPIRDSEIIELIFHFATNSISEGVCLEELVSVEFLKVVANILKVNSHPLVLSQIAWLSRNVMIEWSILKKDKLVLSNELLKFLFTKLESATHQAFDRQGIPSQLSEAMMSFYLVASIENYIFCISPELIRLTFRIVSDKEAEGFEDALELLRRLRVAPLVDFFDREIVTSGAHKSIMLSVNDPSEYIRNEATSSIVYIVESTTPELKENLFGMLDLVKDLFPVVVKNLRAVSLDLVFHSLLLIDHLLSREDIYSSLTWNPVVDFEPLFKFLHSNNPEIVNRTLELLDTFSTNVDPARCLDYLVSNRNFIEYLIGSINKPQPKDNLELLLKIVVNFIYVCNELENVGQAEFNYVARYIESDSDLSKMLADGVFAALEKYNTEDLIFQKCVVLQEELPFVDWH